MQRTRLNLTHTHTRAYIHIFREPRAISCSTNFCCLFIWHFPRRFSCHFPRQWQKVSISVCSLHISACRVLIAGPHWQGLRKGPWPIRKLYARLSSPYDCVCKGRGRQYHALLLLNSGRQKTSREKKTICGFCGILSTLHFVFADVFGF